MLTRNHERDTVDPKNPLAPSYTGVYEEMIEICGKQRRLITYITEDVRASTAGILILPENGVTAREMFEKSNWTELADTDEHKEKFIIFFLEAENKGWQTDEPYGQVDGDIAYIQAVLEKTTRRDKFDVHESKVYLVGYREGGTVAQMAAADNPAVYSGIVSVEAPPVNSDYLLACGESLCTDLNGFKDESGRKGIRKRQIPMPVWLIGEQSPETLSEKPDALYWRKAAGTNAVPRMRKPDVREFYRAAEPEYGCNQEKEAYRIWISTLPGSAKDFGRSMNRRIWSEFLSGVRRWRAEPGGDLRRSYDPVCDLGMDYHWEMVGGWMREWYVYVPDTYRPDRPIPLVFAIHGFACSGEVYVGNSEWFKVARDYGFIVIFPSAVHGCLEVKEENQALSKDMTDLPAWNIGCEPSRPDEIGFFEYMLKNVGSRYNIDRGRVYVTGHSMGSMMTQLLIMARPELFAAAAPCSGVLIMFDDPYGITGLPEVKKRSATDIPVWMFVGEQEPWLMPYIPEKDNITGQTIRIWWELNHMPGEKPEAFNDWIVFRERWHDLVYLKNGIPMLKYTWVDYMPHATMTEMSYRIWEELFSHVKRLPDNRLEWF